jgi:hypothetical protein
VVVVVVVPVVVVEVVVVGGVVVDEVVLEVVEDVVLEVVVEVVVVGFFFRQCFTPLGLGAHTSPPQHSPNSPLSQRCPFLRHVFFLACAIPAGSSVLSAVAPKSLSARRRLIVPLASPLASSSKERSLASGDIGSLPSPKERGSGKPRRVI